MTIQDILAELAAKHGNDWPQAVLAELIFSPAKAAILNQPLDNARHQLLYDWTLSTIHAGIAFRQTAAQ